MTVLKPHCQICGRLIKASKGVIAHHGYERPGQGWQTASCFGARYRPYEVACDALPPAIESCERFMIRTEKLLKDLIDNPPPGFEVEAVLKTFPHDGMMGLPTEAVRTSPEYQAAKQASQLAFDRLRAFNQVYTKQFKRELKIERMARNQARTK